MYYNELGLFLAISDPLNVEMLHCMTHTFSCDY